uniref:Uncharacterized protein n=1 Tax=Globodera rostochiensis TaxID=31243 RepID=A0A914I171_GLORO
MYAILLLVILVRATNALECWQGEHEILTPGGTRDLMVLAKCPVNFTRCGTLTCSMDEKALKGLLGVPPGTKSATTMTKACLPAIGECELQPKEGISSTGAAFMALKKHCKASCCEGNACNGESIVRKSESNTRSGTLGLRSLGTVTAIMAFFAVFFVRWN